MMHSRSFYRLTGCLVSTWLTVLAEKHDNGAVNKLPDFENAQTSTAKTVPTTSKGTATTEPVPTENSKTTECPECRFAMMVEGHAMESIAIAIPVGITPNPTKVDVDSPPKTLPSVRNKLAPLPERSDRTKDVEVNNSRISHEDLQEFHFPTCYNSLDGTFATCNIGAVIFYVILFAVICVISVCGNFLVIYVVWKTARLHRPPAVFKVSLAAADLLLSVLVIPSLLYNLIRHILLQRDNIPAFQDLVKHETTPEWIRRTVSSASLISMTASVLTLLVMAIDRLVATRWPIYHRIHNSMRRPVIAICLVWIVSIVPTIVVNTYSHEELEYRLQAHTFTFGPVFKIQKGCDESVGNRSNQLGQEAPRPDMDDILSTFEYSMLDNETFIELVAADGEHSAHLGDFPGSDDYGGDEEHRMHRHETNLLDYDAYDQAIGSDGSGAREDVVIAREKIDGETISTEDENMSGKCNGTVGDMGVPEFAREFGILYSVACWLLPWVFTIILTVGVGVYGWKSLRSIRTVGGHSIVRPKTSGSSTSSMDSTEDLNSDKTLRVRKSDNKNEDSSRRLVKTLSILVAMYTLCTLPLSILQLVMWSAQDSKARREQMYRDDFRWIWFTASNLFLMQSAFNIFIYHRSREFSLALKQVFSSGKGSATIFSSTTRTTNDGPNRRRKVFPQVTLTTSDGGGLTAANSVVPAIGHMNIIPPLVAGSRQNVIQSGRCQSLAVTLSALQRSGKILMPARAGPPMLGKNAVGEAVKNCVPTALARAGEKTRTDIESLSEVIESLSEVSRDSPDDSDTVVEVNAAASAPLDSGMDSISTHSSDIV